MNLPKYRIDQIVIADGAQHKILGADVENDEWTYYSKPLNHGDNGSSTRYLRDSSISAYYDDVDGWQEIRTKPINIDLSRKAT